MNITKARTTVAALTACVLVACGSADAALTVDARPGGGQGSGNSNGPGALQQLADDCENSVDDSGVGVVDIDGDLQDANVTVDIPVPCLIRLGNNSDVVLNNVTLTAEEINIDDMDADAGRNRIRLQGSQVTTTGFVVTLSDHNDELATEATTITGDRGIVIDVAGTRDDTNTGGTIRMVRTELFASDSGGAGVIIGASEHDGQFRSMNLIVDTPADLFVVAGDCQAQRSGVGQPVDCSTSETVDNLRRQADELRGG